MRSWTIAFSLGIILCGFIPQVPAFPLVLLLGACSLLLHCRRRWHLLGAFGLGCCWLLLYARHSLGELWPVELETVDVWVQGTVWSLPQQTERGLRFEFMVEALCTLSSPAGCAFGAQANPGKKVLLNLYQPLAIRPGQAWRLQVRMRRPHGFANPGGFDYEAWLMQQGIRATGYVRQHPATALLDTNTGRRAFTRLRFALLERLQAAGKGTLRYGHLIRALTLGERGGISEAEWALFSATGTNHLMVISGLHVGLVALVLYRLGWWLATRSSLLVLRWPAPQLAALFGLAGAAIYAGMAGFSLPAQRALLMVAVFLCGKLWRRQTAALHALCLAMALVLLLDPLAPHNAGFWLSFCAVGVLLLTATRAAAAENGVRKAWLAVQTQLVVFLGLLPAMLVFFQQVAPAAPFVNMLAIPFIGLVVVPLALLALLLICIWPAAGALLLRAVDYLLYDYMKLLAGWVDLMPLKLVTLPALPLPLLGLLCLLVLAVLFARRMWQRLLALLVLPLLFLAPGTAVPDGRLRLAVLDVGQGLAVVVSTPHHHLLYDTGPWFSSRFDAGSDVVVPYLRHMNISQLDSVIVSHADADHAGGLAGVVAAYPAARYLASDADIFPSGLRSELCRQGQRWHWDGFDFALLHPDGQSYSRNDGSCVLRISAGAMTILLPGDIERRIENLLLRQGEPGELTLLLAPHHGSRTSSSPAFVTSVVPGTVVYTSGYRNRFNHPLPDVRARYAAVGSRELLTSERGALTFELDATGVVALSERRLARRRFWSSACAETGCL